MMWGTIVSSLVGTQIILQIFNQTRGIKVPPQKTKMGGFPRKKLKKLPVFSKNTTRSFFFLKNSFPFLLTCSVESEKHHFSFLYKVKSSSIWSLEIVKKITNPYPMPSPNPRGNPEHKITQTKLYQQTTQTNRNTGFVYFL